MRYPVVVSVFALVFACLAAGPAHAECSIEGPGGCRAAVTVPCGEGMACACIGASGESIRSCSCACVEPGRVEHRPMTQRGRLGLDEQVAVTLGGEPLPLADLAALLERSLGWRVEVGTEFRETPVGPVEYRGSLRGFLGMLAAATGSDWSVDTSRGTIRLDD